jgi:hypothetical protein
MKFGAWAILLPKFYYAEREPHRYERGRSAQAIQQWRRLLSPG